MTKNFDQFFQKITEDMCVGDVVAGSGDYAPGDARVPFAMGPILTRNGKVNRKKRRKHRK